MTEVMNPSGRFTVLSVGQLKVPAQCYICSSSTRDEGYVDLDAWVEYHGCLYICVPCVQEIARAVGFLDPDYFKSTIEPQLEELTTLRKDNNELRAHIDDLQRVLSSRFATPSKPVADSSGEGVEQEPKTPGTPVKARAVSKPKSSKSTPFA